MIFDGLESLSLLYGHVIDSWVDCVSESSDLVEWQLVEMSFSVGQ